MGIEGVQSKMDVSMEDGKGGGGSEERRRG